MLDTNVSRRQCLLAGANGLAAAILGVPQTAAAQTVSGTARILVGVPPGGFLDAVARLLIEQMKSYAPTMIVEIRPGASYRLAIEAAKNSPADGSVMILAPAGPMTLYPHIYKSLSYDPVGDFAPVSTVCSSSLLLGVGPLVPASVKTVADFIAWCKANARQSSFGTAGAGSPMHFLGITLARTGGFEFTHVPYQGSAPAVQDLLGGQIAAVIAPAGNFAAHLGSGKIRVLATTGRQRTAALPDVPTVAEAGYPVLDFAEWFGILVPAKTSTETVTTLNGLIREALRSKAMLDALRNFTLDAGGNSPAEFAALIKADTERWAGIVKASGFTPMD